MAQVPQAVLYFRTHDAPGPSSSPLLQGHMMPQVPQAVLYFRTHDAPGPSSSPLLQDT